MLRIFSSYAEEYALRSYAASGEKVFMGTFYFELHGLNTAEGAQYAGRNTIKFLIYGTVFSALLFPIVAMLSVASCAQSRTTRQKD